MKSVTGEVEGIPTLLDATLPRDGERCDEENAECHCVTQLIPPELAHD